MFRHPLALLAALSLAWLAPHAAAQAESPSAKSQARPNFIFIITDDQRWDALGCVQRELGDRALFPWFQTPNMDRLAAEGARLRNAFVVHSLCSPSRASFLSGQPTHRHGIRHNWGAMPLDLSTWAHSLRDAGYQTAYFGKWHMGRQPKRPGFDKAFSYVGQGKYNDCVFLDDEVATQTHGWVDDVTTNHAIEYLRERGDQPFGIVIGYKSPHEPRTPPARRANDYSDIQLTVPASHFSIPPFRPDGYQPLSFARRMEDRRNYFRCIAAIDDCLGRILSELDKLGLAEDTVVVFAGDNGYFLGEHASHDKRYAYEESIRIPLLVRFPRRIQPGTLIDVITLNIDLAPTILDLAGVSVPDSMVGQSWAPLFDGSASAFTREGFLYESYRDPEFPKVTFDTHAYRNTTGKLITYPGQPGWAEAFDLLADPMELNDRMHAEDFASERELLVAQLKAALHAAGLDPPAMAP